MNVHNPNITTRAALYLRVPKRLETILASVIDRRQERTERRREHLAELNRPSPRPTSGSAVSMTLSNPAWSIRTLRC